MMIATLRWRDKYKVEDAMKETYPDELNVFGHVYGHDKEGRPVVCVASAPAFCRQLTGLHAGTIYTVAIMTSQLHSATSSGSSGTCLKGPVYDMCLLNLLRWRVALMEHGIKLIDFETVDQMVQVHGTYRVTLKYRFGP